MRIAQGLDLSPMMLLAFPESDEYAVMLDLMRQLPTTRMKPLRKMMRKWIVR